MSPLHREKLQADRLCPKEPVASLHDRRLRVVYDVGPTRPAMELRALRRGRKGKYEQARAEIRWRPWYLSDPSPP